MSRCLSENTIAEVLDDKLSAAQRRRVDQHIDSCADCRSLVAHLVPAVVPSSQPLAPPQPPVEADTWIGHSIGPYQLVRRLGRGGMGTVYEAYYPYIDRRAAVKLLLPSFAADPSLVARFVNEGRAANRIRHPNIVDIYEVEQLANGTAYLLMEYLAGDSLKERLDAKGALGPAATVRIGRQLASALVAAHAQDIVHRDLKPSNVMLVPDSSAIGGERAKLLDFGIAKLPSVGEGAAFATMTNQILGTPIYMAPEQCHGARDVTPQADVYALGVMFFHMLAGQPPFDGSVGGLIAAHINTPPPPLPSPASPQAAQLAQLVRAMLAKTPDKRPTMAVVLARLESLEGAVSGAVPAVVVSARAPITRARLLGLGAVMLALLGGGYFVMRAQKKESPRIPTRSAAATVAVPAPPSAPSSAPSIAVEKITPPPAPDPTPANRAAPRSTSKRAKRRVTNDDVPIFHP